MKITGYLYDDRYLLHDTGSHHPEKPERLKVIHRSITKSGLLKKLKLIKAELADLKWIKSVHDSSYVHRFKRACLSGANSFIYSDNRICTNTYNIARLAVGGVLKATEQVMMGKIDNAFCAVRPPGHHAENNQAMGFCFFNNVAIAAQFLKEAWNINRIGIVDFDVHHGNGGGVGGG